MGLSGEGPGYGSFSSVVGLAPDRKLPGGWIWSSALATEGAAHSPTAAFPGLIHKPVLPQGWMQASPLFIAIQCPRLDVFTSMYSSIYALKAE